MADPLTDATGMEVRSPGRFADRSPAIGEGQGRLSLNVSMPAHLLGRCREAAQAQGVTLAAWVRAAVLLALKAQGP